jgi:hypothetical protein
MGETMIPQKKTMCQSIVPFYELKKALKNRESLKTNKKKVLIPFF